MIKLKHSGSPTGTNTRQAETVILQLFVFNKYGYFKDNLFLYFQGNQNDKDDI